jgi:hypothetical protein
MTAALPARALAALLLSGVAQAQAPERDEGPLVRGELRLGFATFDYAETYQGRTLDTERGVLPAVSGEGELRAGGAFVRGGFRVASGSVSYGGEVQAPTDPSLDGVWAIGHSDAQQLEGRVEAGALVDPDRRLAMLVGLGLRRWHRTIHDTTALSRDGLAFAVKGYSEDYAWGELELGARYAILNRGRDGWDVEARLVRTISPMISVDYFGSTVSLGLEPRLGWRAATSWRRVLSPGWFVVVTGFGEGYAFGASGTDAATGILEPDSRTFRFGLEVGVGVDARL